MSGISCKEFIKDYCANSSFAGVRYIADDTKHYIERLVWVVLIVLAWYGSALLIISAWDSFVHNPISFVVETTYTDWNTKMPAIAVCEDSYNLEKLYATADQIWTKKHPFDLEDVLKEISFYRGKSSRLDIVCNKANANPLCPKSNFSYYADLVRRDCPELIKSCSYNGIHFDCCEYFLPIGTEMGKCFILNSIQTQKQNPYPMNINITNQRGELSFIVQASAYVYTLGSDEIPTITTVQSLTISLSGKTSHGITRYLAVKNIKNDNQVVETYPEQRACRLHDENESGVYPLYSYSACTVKCRKMEQLRLCQCNDHFIVGTSEEERCNITGMVCLYRHIYNLTSLKPKWAQRAGMACDCVASCDETEIIILADFNIGKKAKERQVNIVLSHLPKERFKRSVVRGRLDLVVSIGGTAGLFVGASLISFVEFVFYFTIRYLSNLYLNGKRENRRYFQTDKLEGKKILKEKETPLYYLPKGVGAYATSGVIPYDVIEKSYRRKRDDT